MTLRLHYHPFAQFCWKALIALYEKDLPFERTQVDLGNPEQRAALIALWPFGKFPVLEDEAAGLVLAESGIIIEYLDRVAPESARMIPVEAMAALESRMLERVFDNFLAEPLTKIVVDNFRPDDGHDAIGVAEAKARIATTYDFLESRLAGRTWAAGESFSLADCAGGPSLFYANVAVPIGDRPTLAAYFERIMARPSVKRVVDEARPYRTMFPLPWPTRYASGEL